jgi:hypothetical protein
MPLGALGLTAEILNKFLALGVLLGTQATCLHIFADYRSFKYSALVGARNLFKVVAVGKLLILFAAILNFGYFGYFQSAFRSSTCARF